MILSCITLALVLAVVVSCEYYTFKTGVPTAVSFPAARQKIIDILEKEAVVRGAIPLTIIDLGSGGGQLATKIAQALPTARVIGIEISFFPWLRSVVRQHLLGPQNLTYKRLDFWSYDSSEADVIVLFLTENIIERLSQKLRKELKPGAMVIANDVGLRGDWKPIEAQDNDILGVFQSKIYIYRQS